MQREFEVVYEFPRPVECESSGLCRLPLRMSPFQNSKTNRTDTNIASRPINRQQQSITELPLALDAIAGRLHLAVTTGPDCLRTNKSPRTAVLSGGAYFYRVKLSLRSDLEIPALFIEGSIDEGETRRGPIVQAEEVKALETASDIAAGDHLETPIRGRG